MKIMRQEVVNWALNLKCWEALLNLGVNHVCSVQMLLLPSPVAQRQTPKLEILDTVALQH